MTIKLQNMIFDDYFDYYMDFDDLGQNLLTLFELHPILVDKFSYPGNDINKEFL